MIDMGLLIETTDLKGNKRLVKLLIDLEAPCSCDFGIPRPELDYQ